jgi:superfamily II DNA helicase RecQ
MQTTSNSLYQVIGRAGRIGKEYKARVIFNDINTMKKALLSINDDIEANVMNFYLQYSI